jgi:hypothetical protein
MSTGGVSGVKMNLSTPTTESGGGSPSNFFALHCLQFGTDGSMCDSDGIWDIRLTVILLILVEIVLDVKSLLVVF